MKITGKLGFLGGGLMAEALIKGVLQAGLVSAAQVVAVDLAEDRKQLLAKEYSVAVSSEASALTECEVVILAVKPQVLPKILNVNRQHFNKMQLIISIAAGVSLDVLESSLAGCDCRVIRVMPNTPALILESAAAICGGSLANDDDLQTAVAIFDAVGKSVVVGEAEMDAVTGLSGSGPAYVFSFIEALIDAGVKVGLNRAIAETLALQTVLGATKLAISSDKNLADLRAMVTSPGGTTIAGLHEMERAGFRGIIMDTVESATKRSHELGEMAAQRIENENK